MRMLLWRAYSNALPLKEAPAIGFPNIDAKCDLFGELSESVFHALFECVQAKETWMASPSFDFNQLRQFCSVVKAFDAFKLAHLQHVEAFVAVMWTI